VIARVTGSDLSVINGQLRSDIADADLSILNPNGVLFGDSAQMFVDDAL
jgi:filamentous hemagglutinin family protein